MVEALKNISKRKESVKNQTVCAEYGIYFYATRLNIIKRKTALLYHFIEQPFNPLVLVNGYYKFYGICKKW